MTRIRILYFLGSNGNSVQSQANDLEDQFNDIAVKTYDKISESGMSVGRFKTRLKSLRIEYRDEHEEFLQKMNSEFEQSPTLDGIWDKLSGYWSFLNYTLLENLIYRLGYRDLKKDMNEYLKSLQSFQYNTRLCDFARYYSALKKKEVSADLKDFVIRIELNWETCTLEDLDKLHGHILRKFHLPSFSTTLKELLTGSLIITWSLPSELASHVKDQLKRPDMMAFYKEHSILSISIDGDEHSYGNG